MAGNDEGQTGALTSDTVGDHRIDGVVAVQAMAAQDQQEGISRSHVEANVTAPGRLFHRRFLTGRTMGVP
ncbi:MAG TPA: hypothetical protein DIC52_10660 [Candidatus Latescibacteria bacterium]|nr:hypothetical protein [Candidatus Latescibacterota bacterium]